MLVPRARESLPLFTKLPRRLLLENRASDKYHSRKLSRYKRAGAIRPRPWPNLLGNVLLRPYLRISWPGVLPRCQRGCFIGGGASIHLNAEKRGSRKLRA